MTTILVQELVTPWRETDLYDLEESGVEMAKRINIELDLDQMEE